MSLKGLTDLDIAKEKFSGLRMEKISKKISQEEFREFINSHKEVFL